MSRKLRLPSPAMAAALAALFVALSGTAVAAGGTGSRQAGSRRRQREEARRPDADSAARHGQASRRRLGGRRGSAAGPWPRPGLG
jgi:hypothetical protein